MAQIGSLSVKLGLVTVDWDKGTATAKKSAKDLQSQFDQLGNRVKGLANDFKQWGVASATLGLGLLYHEAVQLSDEVSDLSKSFGLSIPEVLSFRDALQSSGGQAENADKAINSLFGHIAEAKEGNDAAIAQFEKLGISFAELKAMTPYEAIQKVASGFSNIADQFERTKAIKELFGKAGIGLSMEDLAANMQGGSEKNQKYADSLKKVGDVADSIKANVQNLTVAFADLIAPLTSSGVISVDSFSKALKGIAAAGIPLAIGGIALSVLSVATAFSKVALAIKEASVAGAIFNLTAGGASPIGLIIKAVTAAAAIGTFIYVSGSASSESKGPTVTGKVGQLPGGVSATPADVNGSENDSLEVKQKKTAIALQKDLMNLQHKNAQFQSENNVAATELDKKLFGIESQRQQQIAQINAAEKQSLANVKLSAEMKAAISGEAAQNRAKANQEASDAKVNAKAEDRVRLIKDAIEAEAQAAEITRTDTAEAMGFVNDQYIQTAELRRKLDEESFAAEQELLAIDQQTKLEAWSAYQDLVEKTAKTREQLNTDAFNAEVELAAIDQQNTIEAWSYVDAKNAAIKSFIEQADEAERLNKITNKRAEFENTLFTLFADQQTMLRARYDLEEKILEFKYQAEKIGMNTADIERLAAAMRSVGEASNQIKQDSIDAQRTFSAGWTTAFNKYADDANNAGLQGSRTFQIYTDEIGKSIDELVDKGETSFSRLTESILKDLTKMYLKQQMMQIVGNVPGVVSGLGGFISSFFGGGATAASGAEAVGSYASLGPAPVHATGGNVAANSPSWVGERGPELFMPKQSGMIVPNNAIGDSINGKPTNVYNGPYIASMSAIDTQSGLQFLAKNKQGVWASYQSANRSIPMSR